MKNICLVYSVKTCTIFLVLYTVTIAIYNVTIIIYVTYTIYVTITNICTCYTKYLRNFIYTLYIYNINYKYIMYIYKNMYNM